MTVSRGASIVLAAGKGVRMGGAKVLLAWPYGNGESAGSALIPLGAAHALRHADAGAIQVLVVVRQTNQRLLKRVIPSRIDSEIDVIASNAPDDEGPAGSLRVAVSHLELTKFQWLLVTPVDVPPVSFATFRKLVSALGNKGVLAVRPRFVGRRGHPVLLRSSALLPYIGTTYALPLREHLRMLGPACIDVDSDEPDVVCDFNTSADIIRILGTPPRFLK